MTAVRDFLAMGGYAPYVWASYGVTAAVLLLNALLPAWRERRALRLLRNRANP